MAKAVISLFKTSRKLMFQEPTTWANLKNIASYCYLDLTLKWIPKLTKPLYSQYLIFHIYYQCFKWTSTVRYWVPTLLYFERKSTCTSQQWCNTFNWRVPALLRSKYVFWYRLLTLLFSHFTVYYWCPPCLYSVNICFPLKSMGMSLLFSALGYQWRSHEWSRQSCLHVILTQPHGNLQGVCEQPVK